MQTSIKSKQGVSPSTRVIKKLLPGWPSSKLPPAWYLRVYIIVSNSLAARYREVVPCGSGGTLATVAAVSGVVGMHRSIVSLVLGAAHKAVSPQQVMQNMSLGSQGLLQNGSIFLGHFFV